MKNKNIDKKVLLRLQKYAKENGFDMSSAIKSLLDNHSAQPKLGIWSKIARSRVLLISFKIGHIISWFL